MTKRILVVEDQEDNRQIIRDLLDHAGFEVIEVGDGEKALTAASTHLPDFALGGDEAKARAAGCDAYMAKPFSPKALLAKVREYAC
jgi:two-component system cell cycle response regulator DivK